MDVGYLKIKIDIRAEYEEYKKKYEYKRRELKKEEIKKVYEEFKDFFREDGHFKFKENEHSVTAEYRDYGITLDMDIYKNTDSSDFNLNGTIHTFENQVFDLIVEAVSDKEIPLQPAGVSEHDRMVHATRYFQDFLNGDITYTYKYGIKGQEKKYSSMQELLRNI